MKLKNELDALVHRYNSTDFIAEDPISVPHQFADKKDVEIAGFVAALFAWGQRKTIINKANDFLNRMDNSPHEFIMHFRPKDLRVFQDFKHRTFNADDAISVLYFLQHVYQQHQSLEYFFHDHDSEPVRHGLNALGTLFRDLPSTMPRSYKHVAMPARNSACKRLNMFLRWMVRPADTGVDFGLWTALTPADLIMPLDVHVIRSANRLGLLDTDKSNWKTAVALTATLAKFDQDDPVKYDFALFPMGIVSMA